MTEHNPYAAPKPVVGNDENPPPLRLNRTRWQEFPAALLTAIGAWAVLASFETLLLPDGIRISLFGVDVTDSGAILCFAAGCSWLVSANALLRRRWNRAVVWLVVGIGCLGVIAWLNQVVPP